MVPFRKKIRLYKFNYQNTSNVCSLTLCAANQKKVFANEEFVKECIELLKEYSRAKAISIYAYCFMPDHLHLLVSPSAEKDLISFVREIKSLSTKIGWKYGIKSAFWQRSFYDHFLRKEEAIKKVAQYILCNPVRKGIVSDWHEYPYCGSFVWDL